MTELAARMIRAAKLDVHLYEEVETSPDLLKQAMLVVVISSVAAGIGSIGRSGIVGIFATTLLALIGWYIWAYLTFLIGTKVLPEPQTESSPSELLRTTGFSSSPGVIRVLAIVPGLESIVLLVSSAWMLVAMVIAVRQALDYKSTLRAVGVCVIGWIVQIMILAVLYSVFLGGTKAG